MRKAYLFYNPLAGGGKVLEDLEALEFVLDEEVVLCNMTRPETYEEALFDMNSDDYLVLCGGDGTLNRFANLTGELHRSNEIYYYPAGTNNDFARDYGRYYGNNPFPITQELRNLPRVQMGNKSGCFLTGILFQTGSGIRRFSGRNRRYNEENSPKVVNVSVDKALHRYKNVQFAAILQGRYCGGGMIPDPERRRQDETLSCVLIHSCGRSWARRLTGLLRKGRRVVSHCFTIHQGMDISLTFDEPVCLQTDGELQTGVTSVRAIASRKDGTL